MPIDSERWRVLQDSIGDTLGYFRVDQSVWYLFAPDPIQFQSVLEVEVGFADGSRYIWNSPDWYELSPLSKLRNNRALSYYIYLAQVDSGREAFLEYFYKKTERKFPAKRISSLTLIRKTFNVAPPADDSLTLAPRPEKIEYSEQKELIRREY